MVGQQDSTAVGQWDGRTVGWQGSRTAGQWDSRMAGQRDGGTVGQQGRRVVGQRDGRTAALLSPTASGIPQARGSSAQQQHLSRGSSDARRQRRSLSTYSSKLVHLPLQCRRNNNKHTVQKVNM